MAVSKILEKVRATVVLAISGDKTANISLGSLSTGNFDAEKALSIASALIPCLDGSFSKCNVTETSRLEEE